MHNQLTKKMDLMNRCMTMVALVITTPSRWVALINVQRVLVHMHSDHISSKKIKLKWSTLDKCACVVENLS